MYASRNQHEKRLKLNVNDLDCPLHVVCRVKEKCIYFSLFWMVERVWRTKWTKSINVERELAVWCYCFWTRDICMFIWEIIQVFRSFTEHFIHPFANFYSFHIYLWRSVIRVQLSLILRLLIGAWTLYVHLCDLWSLCELIFCFKELNVMSLGGMSPSGL